MKKLILASVCIILSGYAISAVVGYVDPAVKDPFAGLTQEEMAQGIQTLSVASGEAPVFVVEPSFEEMAVEDTAE